MTECISLGVVGREGGGGLEAGSFGRDACRCCFWRESAGRGDGGRVIRG